MSEVTKTIEARNLLDAAMYRAEMSGAELARRLGVAPSQVSMWRNGLIPAKKWQAKIAKRLGTTPDQLWPS